MTIRTRFLVWFFPILTASAAAIAVFAYLNEAYDLLPQKNFFAYMMASLLIFTMIVVGTVIVVAHKISRPLQSLNSAALAIAAGEYGKRVEIKGPKEVIELAHTLNTMSECLEEQIQRIRESSLLRERLNGEYECSLLLQHHMLHKVIEEFSHSALSARLIKVVSSKLLSGFLLDLQEDEERLEITVAEAKEKGFQGIFDLLQDRGNLDALQYPRIHATLKNGLFRCRCAKMACPIIWSARKKALMIPEEKEEVSVESGDLVFFYNNGFKEQFQRHQLIQSWFGKVLRHFAMESFDAFAMVLRNELNFLANKQHIRDDLYILCFKIEQV